MLFRKFCIQIRQYYSMKNPVIGVCQMCVTDDKERNFNQAQSLVKECKKLGAVMVFLPEACDYITTGGKVSVAMAESMALPDKDNVFQKYSCLAKDNGVWLSLGGMHRKFEGDPADKFRNTHVVIDDQGNLQGCYDKCHLFDVDIPSKVTLKETDIAVPGTAITKPVDTPVGKIGLMVCYDLRFPQISTILRHQGAEILTYPSAFTVPTGRAHWEVLLRARAVENQCYVVAAAQVGQHNEKRTSYGHSLIVDPWGKVAACASDGVGVITAEIDLDYLKNLRLEMPLQDHTRHDLYNSSI